MDKIFIDLEFCKISAKYLIEKEQCKSEIIQIGAVRVNDNNCITERFNRLVKPSFSVVSKRITELTGITEGALEGAESFSNVFDEFMTWVGEEPVKVYSWGFEDKMQIRKECRLKNYKSKTLSGIMNNWIDYQKQFDKLLGAKQQISLANALKGADIQFEGREHSAIDDAENTARLYLFTCDNRKFHERARIIKEMLEPTPELTFNLGSLFTEEMKKSLSIPE